MPFATACAVAAIFRLVAILRTAYALWHDGGAIWLTIIGELVAHPVMASMAIA